MASQSEWDTPSGLLTGYEGTVIEALFQINEMNGNLNIELRAGMDKRGWGGDS